MSYRFQIILIDNVRIENDDREQQRVICIWKDQENWIQILYNATVHDI